MTVFRMPSLGADMEDGTLIEWLVQPGDRVTSGDVVAVVETHKGAIEIEIFESGVIESLDVKVGVTVPVGSPLATLLVDGEPATTGSAGKSDKRAVNLPDEAEEELAEERSQETERPAPPPAAVKATAVGNAASPAARRRAAEVQLDLNGVPGSGPNGAVLLTDVEQHLQKRVQTAPDPKYAAPVSYAAPMAGPAMSRAGKPGLDMASMRATIAAAMSRSKREIPHYYLRHSIDLQTATDWLDTHNAEHDPDQRLLMGVLFMKATALAVKRTPELNGQYTNGRFFPADKANVGMAISLRGGGLIAPAVQDVAGKSLDNLMAATRDLVARTRAGRLKNAEMTSGTITISSMGENGVESLYGVIYPPQVALVGFGTPTLQPRVIAAEIRPRLTVVVTLAGDHRVSDGRRGARLLIDIERYLQEPEAL